MVIHQIREYLISRPDCIGLNQDFFNRPFVGKLKKFIRSKIYIQESWFYNVCIIVLYLTWNIRFKCYFW